MYSLCVFVYATPGFRVCLYVPGCVIRVTLVMLSVMCCVVWVRYVFCVRYLLCLCCVRVSRVCWCVGSGVVATYVFVLFVMHGCCCMLLLHELWCCVVMCCCCVLLRLFVSCSVCVVLFACRMLLCV